MITHYYSSRIKLHGSHAGRPSCYTSHLANDAT